jgi:hypothetical protein
MQNAPPSIAPGGASPLPAPLRSRIMAQASVVRGVGSDYPFTPLSSRIEISSTGANHRRRIVATLRKMSRICARVWSNPCELSTTKSARRRLSPSGISVTESLMHVLPGASGKTFRVDAANPVGTIFGRPFAAEPSAKKVEVAPRHRPSVWA